MFGKLKKFIKDRRGISGLGRLLVVLAMVGIIVAVALNFRDKANALGNKAYQESFAKVDRIN